MTRISTLIAAAALAACASSALAQSRVEAGALECRGTGSATFIVGSVHELNCVFRPTAGPPHAYIGTIRRVGLDLGVTSRLAVGWLVLAPTRVVGPGDLAGSYGGVAAGAAVGVGVGANALVGGSNNSFALQPVSIEGQTGLGIAAGVAAFELRAVR
jgi:Protein of unknown function (DUF992)